MLLLELLEEMQFLTFLTNETQQRIAYPVCTHQVVSLANRFLMTIAFYASDFYWQRFDVSNLFNNGINVMVYINHVIYMLVLL